MSQKPMLLKYPTGVVPQPLNCCPEVKTETVQDCCPPQGISPHDRPIPREEVDPCVDAKPVTICGAVDIVPAAPVCSPITVPYVDCDGAAQVAAGTTCDMVQVVPHPSAVMPVRICNPTDIEKTLMCDPATGGKVLIVVDFSNGAQNPIVSYWDLAFGAPWSGDPTTLEMCPDAVNDCTPTITSAFGDSLTGLLPGTTISVQKSDCCVVQINTSAGNFIIAKHITGWSTADWNCPVTVTSAQIISGNCDLSDVIITTQSS